MPYGSVLIIDDVETNLYVAKGLLSPYGLSVDTAVSGFEAIEKIKAGKVYDIVFMDHMMPKMDGVESTRFIRDLGYTQPIIALTANTAAGQVKMFLSNGFDGFIFKPIDVHQLDSLLNRLIRDKQPPEMIEAARKGNLQKPTADKTLQLSVVPELAHIFVRDAEKASAVLKALYEKRDNFDVDDIALYTINVHAMKSALANIGEMELSGAARTLEAAGQEQNVAVISSETPAFLTGLQAMITRIVRMERDDDSETTDEDTVYLHEKIRLFQEACEAYNKKAAKNALFEIKKKKWSRQTKDTLNILTEHLLHSDFDEAIAVSRGL
jgi:CheY-like chemotaxis protein